MKLHRFCTTHCVCLSRGKKESQLQRDIKENQRKRLGELVYTALMCVKMCVVKGIRGGTGIPGSPGMIGNKGNKGDHGLPGERGKKGDTGDRGMPENPGPDVSTSLSYGKRCTASCQQGMPGVDGDPGLEGRKGVPVSCLS